MQRSLLAAFVFLTLLALQTTALQTCATPTAPTGGPRDTIGPVLVLDESTPNFQTNFRPEEIVLTFDEWVELDPKQPILISPPITFGPDNRPKLRRRSLIIPMEGLDLLDSVTYVVNVGGAIKDLNEGNPTDNLRFVFATGPVLDSATVSGTLVSDYSAEPIENATFTLFANLADSAVTTENPTYFAQTDKTGAFTVYNVRPGRYRAVALQRNPSATNYFYDTSGFALPQAVGFIDTILTIKDGANSAGTVRLSPILKPVQVNGVDTSLNGAIRLTINQPAETVDARFSGTYLRRNLKDTLTLFYRQAVRDTILVGRQGNWVDTIYFEGLQATGEQPLRVLSTGATKIYPAGGLRFSFNRPIERIDTSLATLTRDTFPEPIDFQYFVDTLDAGNLIVRAPYVTKSRYELTLLPGAVTDWVGNTNRDTLQRRFSADDPENYGTLKLTFTNLLASENYIVRLLRKGEVMAATFRYIQERFEYEVTYPGLSPDTYQVELLYDSNRNGRYDSGDFLFGLQPEEVRRIDIEPLRANWEVAQTIRVDFDTPVTSEPVDD